MTNDAAFAWAVGIGLALSAGVIALLWGPLHGILVDLCGTAARARFWRSFAAITLVLVPLAAVLLGRAAPRAAPVSWDVVVDQAKWALLGLLAALFTVALGVAAFIPQRATVSLDADQMDDLQRLLAKVEEIRARQILKRSNEPEERRA